jgi:hypothetical protein
VLHERVDDGGVDVAVDHPYAGVEHLADDEDLVGALRERPQVHLPGGQRHRARVDHRDPQHRHEDAAAGSDPDDEAEHPGRSRPDGHRRHRVADPSDVLPVRPENGQTDHAGDEHPGHRGAGGAGHVERLAAAGGLSVLRG